MTRVTLCSLHVVFSCRKGQSGGLLWPGFGDNIRVIEWILGAATLSTHCQAAFCCPDYNLLLPSPGRCDGTIPASGRPIGWVPTREELQLLDIEVKCASEIFFVQ